MICYGGDKMAKKRKFLSIVLALSIFSTPAVVFSSFADLECLSRTVYAADTDNSDTLKSLKNDYAVVRSKVVLPKHVDAVTGKTVSQNQLTMGYARYIYHINWFQHAIKQLQAQKAYVSSTKTYIQNQLQELNLSLDSYFKSISTNTSIKIADITASYNNNITGFVADFSKSGIPDADKFLTAVKVTPNYVNSNNTGNTEEPAVPEKRVRIGMSGDFTNTPALELHEHYLWKQVCCRERGKGNFYGICGCISSLGEPPTCWGSDGFVSGSGCLLISISMAAYDAGAVPVNFTPYDWVIAENNADLFEPAMLVNSKVMNGHFKQLGNCEANQGIMNGLNGNPYRSTSLSKTEAEAKIVQDVESLLANEDIYVVFYSESGGEHAIYCMGTADNPNIEGPDKRDFVICDPGRFCTNSFVKGGDALIYGGFLSRFQTYQSFNCTPFVNGMTGSATTDLTQTGSIGGDSLFVDEEEIKIPSMKVYLNELSNSDLQRISDIEFDLRSQSTLTANSKLLIFSKVLGSVLIVYCVLFMAVYFLSLSPFFMDVGLLGLITFHTFEESVVVYTDDCTEKTLSLKKTIMILLVGLISASMLINPVELINLFSNLYYLITGKG